MSKHILKRIVVALSGGIDSSVSAQLLSNIPNSTLLGLHMSNWNASDENSSLEDNSESNNRGQGRGRGSCEQSERDATDAQQAADFLGIKMARVGFESEYWHGVFEPFIEGLGEDRTINPDVGCNSIVKFGTMREYAMRQLNADFIATGHYARLWHRYNDHGNNHNKILQATSSPPPFLEAALAQNPDDEWVYEWGMKHDGTRSSKAPISPLLLAGADTTKDQSYFLCGVNGMAFSNVLFPLGNLKKNTKSNKEEAQKSVREMVADFPPSISNKKESMGICFIGKRNFADFVAEYLPSEAIPGDFIDIDTGEVVGKHNGAAFYTIGQGAKVSGARTKYFTAKKNANGSIFVCNDTHHPSLYSDELYMLADQFNWIVGELPRPLEEGKDMVALCRTRHLQPLIPCVVSIRGSHIVVKFDRPIRAITPGQTAAIYVGDGLVCVGGGQISEHGHTYNELGLTLPSTLHPSGANDISCPT